MANKKDIYAVSDSEFTQAIENSKSYRECLVSLGITTYTNEIRNILKQRIKELNIPTSHFELRRYSLEEIFCENSLYSGYGARLINYMIKNNLREYKCEHCGCNGIHNEKSISLQLHHKSGIHTDNRLENLEILCPNCHSQTDTYGGKKNKGKVSDNKKVYTCKMCGAHISHGSTFCKSCAGKEYSKVQSIKNNIPQKEYLELLLQSKTVSEIARQHNVSFNAVLYIPQIG